VTAYYRRFQTLNYRFIFLVLIIPGFTVGQNYDYQLRIAQTLEKNKEYENALEIYQKLDTPDHRNPAIVNGVVNCLKNLLKNEELVTYLNSVRIDPQNQMYLMITLAEAYALTDRKEKAAESWDKILQTQKTNVNAYRLVASSMTRLRYYDEATGVYERAIENIQGQYFLHLEIGNLYASRLDVENAVKHYLLYYQHFPKQKDYLQRQVLNLTKEETHVIKVAKVLNNYLVQHEKDEDIKDILGGLYINSGDFPAAYKIYQSMENEKSYGKFLFKFGSEAFKNRAYDFSAKSFSEIISNPDYAVLHTKSEYELARTNYFIAIESEKQHLTDKMNQHLNKAIVIFESLKQKKDINYFSDYSCLYLGTIYLDQNFDIDRAITYYEFILTNFRKSNIFYKAIIKLGDSYLIKGNLKKAYESYKLLKDQKYYSIGEFKLAELEYYRGNFSAAKMHYNEIINTSGLTDSLANNVLERKMFISSFEADSVTLKKYAHAELQLFQKKYSEAIESFGDVTNTKTEIAVYAGKEAARLLIKLDKQYEATVLLSQLIEDFPEDNHADEIFIMLADTEEYLGNLQKSFSFYQKILNEFGTSLYYDQARKKARELSERIRSQEEKNL